MKIIEIRITPVAIPLKEHYHWAGRVDSEAPPILVEVESDEGIVGIGECSASFSPRSGSALHAPSK
jgi:L-alanine-DL-glutamate epimerase-like enolase superfamily enzyme